MTKMAKIDTLVLTKTAENPFGATHTYIARSRVYLINQMESIRYCKVAWSYF